GLASGRPAEARKPFEDALQLREAGGLVRAESRQNLAALLRAEGKPAEALAACQQAIDELRERGLVAQEADALALLAELALDGGDEARARAAAKRALSLGDEWLRIRTNKALAATIATIDFASGDRDAPERLEMAIGFKQVPEGAGRLAARVALGRLWLR